MKLDAVEARLLSALTLVNRRFPLRTGVVSEIEMFQQLAHPFENAAAIFVLKISQSPRQA